MGRDSSTSTTTSTSTTSTSASTSTSSTSTSTSTSSTSTSATSSTTTTSLPPLCGPAPAVGCHGSAPGGSSVKLKNDLTDAKDQLKWRWGHGTATDIAEFGNPVAGSGSYRLCIYDASGNPQPLLQADVPPGGLCGTRPCWVTTGATGFSYRNFAAAPNGITSVKLKAGSIGKAKIQVAGKGVQLTMPTLGLTMPVTVQLVVGDATTACWQTVFTTPKRNGSDKFVAKGP